MDTTIQEVAKKINVSISTVSRVLNNSGYVSAETREKVLSAAESLGYRRNRIASSLRSQRSDFIGLIVPDVANEFFSTLASVIERNLHLRGYSVFLCNSTENEAVEKRYIESLMENQVRGMVLVSAGINFDETLFHRDVPVVLIDRLGQTKRMTNIVTIESDNAHGGEIAARELFERGARRFLFIGDRRNMHAMELRRRRFSEMLRAMGVPAENLRELLIPVSPIAAKAAIQSAWEASPFDGVFCGTDLLAIGAMKGLIELGVQIPNQVQFIGFDGIQLGEFTSPSLSTVQQDILQMGRIAAESMDRMIQGEKINRHETVPVAFIPRDSTR